MGPYYDHQVGRFEGPDLPSERERLMLRARRARAQAMAEIFGGLYRGAKGAAKAVVNFVRCAGAGAALMPPRSNAHHQGAARLTGGCH